MALFLEVTFYGNKALINMDHVNQISAYHPSMDPADAGKAFIQFNNGQTLITGETYAEISRKLAIFKVLEPTTDNPDVYKDFAESLETAPEGTKRKVAQHPALFAPYGEDSLVVPELPKIKRARPPVKGPYKRVGCSKCQDTGYPVDEAGNRLSGCGVIQPEDREYYCDCANGTFAFRNRHHAPSDKPTCPKCEGKGYPVNALPHTGVSERGYYCDCEKGASLYRTYLKTVKWGSDDSN